MSAAVSYKRYTQQRSVINVFDNHILLSKNRLLWNNSIPRRPDGKRRSGLYSSSEVACQKAVIEALNYYLMQLEHSNPKVFAARMKNWRTHGLALPTSFTYIGMKMGVIYDGMPEKEKRFRLNHIERILSRLCEPSIGLANKHIDRNKYLQFHRKIKQNSGFVGGFLWDYYDAIRVAHKKAQKEGEKKPDVSDKRLTLVINPAYLSLYERYANYQSTLRVVKSLKTQNTDNQCPNPSKKQLLLPTLKKNIILNKNNKENGKETILQSPIGDKKPVLEQDKLINPIQSQNVNNPKGREDSKVGDLSKSATFEKEQPLTKQKNQPPNITKTSDSLAAKAQICAWKVQQLFPDFNFQYTENQLFIETSRFLKYLHRSEGKHQIKQPNWEQYATQFMVAIDACLERKELDRFNFKYKPIGAYGFLSLARREEDGQKTYTHKGEEKVFTWKKGDFIMQKGCLRFFMEEIMPKEELSQYQSKYIARITNDSIREDAAILADFYMERYRELLKEPRNSLKNRHYQLCQEFRLRRERLKLILGKNEVGEESQRTILAQFSRDTAEKTRQLEMNNLIDEWTNYFTFEMYPALVRHGYGYEGRVKVVKGYIASKTKEIEEIAKLLNCRPVELKKAKKRLERKMVFTI